MISGCGRSRTQKNNASPGCVDMYSTRPPYNSRREHDNAAVPLTRRRETLLGDVSFCRKSCRSDFEGYMYITASFFSWDACMSQRPLRVHLYAVSDTCVGLTSI